MGFGKKIHFVDMMSWGNPYSSKRQPYRRKYRNPIKDSRRAGYPEPGNNWKGSCGVRFYGGMFGQRVDWRRSAFKTMTQFQRDEWMHGPFNLINKYNTITTDLNPWIDRVASFPNATRHYVLEIVMLPLHEDTMATLRSLLTGNRNDTSVTVCVRSIQTCYEVNHEVLADNDPLLRRAHKFAGTAFDAVRKVCGTQAQTSLRMVRDEGCEVSLATTLRWYIQNNDPRPHVSIYSAAQRPLHVVVFVPSATRLHEKFAMVLKKQLGFVRVKSIGRVQLSLDQLVSRPVEYS